MFASTAVFRAKLLSVLLVVADGEEEVKKRQSAYSTSARLWRSIMFHHVITTPATVDFLVERSSRRQEMHSPARSLIYRR